MDDCGLKLPRAGLKELFLWAIGRRKRFRIEGDSMRPLLKPGDEVLVDGAALIKVGDLVVANHPFQKKLILIKRIKSETERGYELEGINHDESSDSRFFGVLSKDKILGKVTSIF